METPFLIQATLPANSKVRTSDIVLTRCRTFSITARVDFHAAATSGVRVSIYYSPDGSNWDTVPFAYYDIVLVAGATAQQTQTIDVPEHGYIVMEVHNLDTAQVVRNIKLWYSIQAYLDTIVMARGAELAPKIEELK